jgi:hypothetical protein
LVAFDLSDRPHFGLVGVLTVVLLGAPLAEQVPALIKLLLELLQPEDVRAPGPGAAWPG